MEGPYLNPAYGAYKELSRPPALAEYQRFVSAARGRLRTMTIAPEIPGVPAMVRDLQRLTGGSMVFSVGHSLAGAEEIDALVPSGLRLCTHLFNATGCSVEPTRYEGTREVGVYEAVLLNGSSSAIALAADRPAMADQMLAAVRRGWDTRMNAHQPMKKEQPA